MDIELRRKELDLKERDLQARREELRAARLWNPLVVAIVGATLAAIANVALNWTTAQQQRELEILKNEHAVILEGLRAKTPDQAATNLAFILNAGLVKNAELATFVNSFIQKRSPGTGPLISSYNWVTTDPAAFRYSATSKNPNIDYVISGCAAASGASCEK